MNKRSKSTLNLNNQQMPLNYLSNRQKWCPTPLIYDQKKENIVSNIVELGHNCQSKFEDQEKKRSKRIALMTKVSVPTDSINHLFSRNRNGDMSGKSSTNQTTSEGLKFKNKSVYQQYRERIEKELPVLCSRQNKNSEIQILKSENEELKNCILTDIRRLKLVRQKSEKSLKKCQSTNELRVHTQVKVAINKNELKKRAIEKNKEKLANIR